MHKSSDINKIISWSGYFFLAMPLIIILVYSWNTPLYSQAQLQDLSFKKIFQKLNLDNTIELKFDNVKKTRVLKSKWELITSHTARRTYISLNINKGIGIDTIMRTTGHNNFETLRIYVKQSQQSIYDEFMKVIQN